MFRGKRAMLSLTTGGPAELFQEDGYNGDMQAILRPIHRGMLEFTGFSVLAPQIHYAAAHVTQEVRAQWLQEWASRLQNIQTETPITIGRY